MLRVNQLKMSLDSDIAALKKATAVKLKISQNDILDFSIAKKAVDCRKKDNVFFVYNVDVTVRNESAVLAKCGNDVTSVEPFSYTMPEIRRESTLRPVVVGFGPAGMFCALTLARANLRPIVLERGDEVDIRTQKVNKFWTDKSLDTESNVQFGEGGAGTFSDGKLTTGIKDPLCRKVFLELASHGAPEEILYSAKPHIGTDKLATVVKNIRNEIISLGGEMHFNTKLSDIIVANGVIQGVRCECADRSFDIETDTVILAIGHSSRDTVTTLYNRGINMMQKPFSVGVRIEHPREFIDKAQYGSFAGHPALGAADYKLACHPPHGRGAYTFCMCPGGTVVAAASEEGGVVVNGMSKYARDEENSNSAILVGIDIEDFPTDHPLSGIDLQRKIEQTAYSFGGSDYTAPAQLVGDFLNNKESTKFGAVKASCPTGVTPSDIRRILPKRVTDTLSDALVKMDKQIKGFAIWQNQYSIVK